MGEFAHEVPEHGERLRLFQMPVLLFRGLSFKRTIIAPPVKGQYLVRSRCFGAALLDSGSGGLAAARSVVRLDAHQRLLEWLGDQPRTTVEGDV